MRPPKGGCGGTEGRVVVSGGKDARQNKTIAVATSSSALCMYLKVVSKKEKDICHFPVYKMGYLWEEGFTKSHKVSGKQGLRNRKEKQTKKELTKGALMAKRYGFPYHAWATLNLYNVIYVSWITLFFNMFIHKAITTRPSSKMGGRVLCALQERYRFLIR